VVTPALGAPHRRAAPTGRPPASGTAGPVRSSPRRSRGTAAVFGGSGVSPGGRWHLAPYGLRWSSSTPPAGTGPGRAGRTARSRSPPYGCTAATTRDGTAAHRRVGGHELVWAQITGARYGDRVWMDWTHDDGKTWTSAGRLHGRRPHHPVVVTQGPVEPSPLSPMIQRGVRKWSFGRRDGSAWGCAVVTVEADAADDGCAGDLVREGLAVSVPTARASQAHGESVEQVGDPA
jgi:hypothetical protein